MYENTPANLRGMTPTPAQQDAPILCMLNDQEVLLKRLQERLSLLRERLTKISATNQGTSANTHAPANTVSEYGQRLAAHNNEISEAVEFVEGIINTLEV